MSRTYRRSKGDKTDLNWVLRDRNWIWVDVEGGYQWRQWITTYVDPKSKEGKLRLAKYYSDAGTHSCKEPGPSWWRNLTTQRPLRRDADRQLKLFMLNDEYEVILDSKPPLEYWT